MGAGTKGKGRCYPALSSLKKRRKSRDYVDYDYLKKLSPDEKAFLNQFTDEYYNGNGYKFERPMLPAQEMARKNYLARADVMNEHHRIDLADGGAPESAEDAMIDVLDGDRPVLERRTFPVPSQTKIPGSTGPGVFAHRPALESGLAPTDLVDGALPVNSSYPSMDWSETVSKTGHQKKRAQKKLTKLKAAPPPAQAAQGNLAGDVFRQTANVLKGALIFGVNARAAAQAIELMEQSAIAADAAGQKPAVAAAPAPVEGEGAANG